MNFPTPDATPNLRPPDGERNPRRFLIGLFATVIGLALLVSITGTCSMGKVRNGAQRSVASTNLRQIGQASLIYASDHKDKLPGTQATDVWDYARLAALEGGLNDATIWASPTDPATRAQDGTLTTVLNKDRTGLKPEFRKLKPTWAVALGEIHAGLPATTPIAWTRGLRSDGTWPAHGPNGTDGGHVVFLGGNVVFLRDTHDAFVRFDDPQKPCTDIRDALPPGTRIAQYEPSTEEQAAWARDKRIQYVEYHLSPLLLPGAWLAVGLVLLAQAMRRRWPFEWFLWYLVVTLLAAVITPTV